MADTEVCGAPTSNGPCTMKKGHEATWHRARAYKKTFWRIKAGDPIKIINSGEARVPLQYAITDALGQHDNIVIEVEVGGR